MLYRTKEGRIVDLGIQINPTDDDGHEISFHHGSETVATVKYTAGAGMTSAEWVAYDIQNAFIIAESELKTKGYT